MAPVIVRSFRTTIRRCWHKKARSQLTAVGTKGSPDTRWMTRMAGRQKVKGSRVKTSSRSPAVSTKPWNTSSAPRNPMSVQRVAFREYFGSNRAKRVSKKTAAGMIPSSHLMSSAAFITISSYRMQRPFSMISILS